MRKTQTFSATPTAADSTTPMPLTTIWMKRKEKCTSTSCKAMGTPTFRMGRRQFLKKRTWERENAKGRPRFQMTTREMSTLRAWAATVAMAAPLAPIPSPATRNRSPTMLNRQATATVNKGVLESPNPRKMAPNTL